MSIRALPVLLLATAACGGGGGGSRVDGGAEVGGDAGSDATPDGRSDSDTAESHDATDASDAPTELGPPACAVVPTATPLAYGTASELAISGDVGSSGGIFDPSVVYPAGATAGAMSYSSVQNAHSIRTRIAVSTDHGATWATVKDANAPQAASIDSLDLAACPSGTCSGTLINEVSSLVYDVDDPDAGRRWKLFTHRYLVLPGDQLRYDMGHIALSTAAAPDGTWTAPAPLVGWKGTSSFSSSGVVFNAGDVPQLASCVAMSEPGAIWLPGALDLALTCVRMNGGSSEISIVLLRSTDHAASFSYVTTLVSAAEAGCFTGGAPSISAPDLFVAGGKEYLIATPQSAGGYRGCLVFPIDDAATGAVHRDASGKPAPSRLIAATPDRFNGACTYAEGATAMGYALSVAFLEAATRQFRIFPTQVLAP